MSPPDATLPARRLPRGLVVWLLAVLAAGGFALLAVTTSGAGRAVPSSIPVATAAEGSAAVGAVFVDGSDGPHDCTGSVISSAAGDPALADRGDIVLTSAHCLSGTGSDVTFAPGYRAGAAPFGRWDVAAVYVDPRWTSDQDPQHDYAFMVVAAQVRAGRSVRLRDVVAGNPLGVAPEPGSLVEVLTYADVFDARPITCTTATYSFAGYPAFDCDGYTSGTSGAPWLTRDEGHVPVVSGIIGGLHAGGCLDYTSYSPVFDRDTLAVYERAVSGAAPDRLPTPHGSDCG